MSRKFLVLGAALLVAAVLAVRAEAASTDDCLLKVSVKSDLSVSISTASGGVNWEALSADTDTVYSASITTVTNDSAENTIETYSAKI